MFVAKGIKLYFCRTKTIDKWSKMYQITTFLKDDENKDVIDLLRENKFDIEKKKKDGVYKLNIKTKFAPTVLNADKTPYESEISHGSVCDVVFSLKEATSGRQVLMIMLEAIKVAEEGKEAAATKEEAVKMLFD